MWPTLFDAFEKSDLKVTCNLRKMAMENTKYIFLKPVITFIEYNHIGIISQGHGDRLKIWPCLVN
jgi:hypothetical protein